MGSKWVIPEEDSAAVERLARTLGISSVTARLLVSRGLADALTARKFMEPSLLELRDPSENEALVQAAAFLCEAARGGRRITVFGDYDADGICATALLVGCLEAAGAQVDFHIPNRVAHGYGLSCDALETLKGRGTEVVLTVDCGISSHREAEHAAALGIDLVVTDHHKPTDGRPDALHVLNPLLEDCDFGYRHLAGVGVAFKLAWALGQALSGGPAVSQGYRDVLIDGLSLVALGTVADMVPLVDENRVLVHYGLRAMPHTASPGLRALLDNAEATGTSISARQVAFHLAPRLNAVGRMGDAAVAVQMLLAKDPHQAGELAAHHDQQNRLRRSVQKAIFQEAEQRVRAEVDLTRFGCIVLSSAQWHPGVVGLVASKLAETFWRPAFVFTEEDGMARGSARSIPGFPLFEAICQCEELVERFGGHEGAAGLTLQVTNLSPLAERMNDLAAQMMGSEPPQRQIDLDGEVRLGELNTAVLGEIRRLAPFGAGNPEPLLMAGGLSVAGSPQLVGSRRSHVAFLVRQGDTSLRAIGFGKAEWLEGLMGRRGETFALAFRPMINTFSGTGEVELRAEDLQWESEPCIERRAPVMSAY